jgi:hypothetical protein
MIEDREFLAILNNEKEAADSFINSNVVSESNATSLRYYQGGKLGNEVTGRSQVVARDVYETVEWIMPQLMEMFSGDVVRIAPQGPEDVEGSDQASDYLQYVFFRRNAGFIRLYDWFKDALIFKNAIMKYEWENRSRPELHRYNALDPDEVAAIVAPENVELLEVEELQDGRANIKIARFPENGKANLKVVANENFLVREGTDELEDADYCAELFTATKSDLLSLGFDPDLVEKAKFDENTSLTKEVIGLTRQLDTGSQLHPGTTGMGHKSMRRGQFVAAYIRIDRDEDGFAELLQVIHQEGVILSVEEVDEIPFLDIKSVRMPHKWHGMSIADAVKDLQEIRTVLVRGILDHTYMTINGRWAVVDGQVNTTDLTGPAPWGVVRQSAPGMVEPLQTPPLDASAFGLLDYLDQIREDRAGVNRIQQGVDKNAMGSNVADGALERAMRAAQQRILLLARMFAEQGVKPLFQRLYGLLRKNQMRKEVVRLRGKFVEVAPFDWKDMYDMEILVGTGNTSPKEQLFELTTIRDSMQMMLSSGAGIVSPENLYNMSVEMVKATGRKDFDRYFTQPPANPPPPQPNIDQQLEAREVAVKEKEQQLKEEEFKLEREKFEFEKLISVAEIELEDKQERAVGLQTGK